MCVVCASLRPWNDTCDYADLEATGPSSSGASSTSGGGSTAALPWLTPDQVADKLLLDFWDAAAPVGFDAQAGDTITVDTSGLTAEARAAARIALDEWSLSTGLIFAEVASGMGQAQIVFDDEKSGAYAYSDLSATGEHLVRSYVNVAKGWWGGDVSVGGYGYQTYLHEIGHALGLGHAGKYNANHDKDGDGKPEPITFEGDAEFANDSWQMTVMSYFDQRENPNVDASFAFLLTPMLGDLASVWRLYNPEGSLSMHEGDTVYGRGSNAAGVLGTSAFGKFARSLTIHDTGGVDHIDLSHTTIHHQIDLRPGAISDAFGRKGTLVLSDATVIEHASAGSGQDHLIGNHLANRLSGGGGNDTLDGREGDDTLDGGDGSDRIHGGAYGEEMESGDDRIAGGAGDDEIHGGDGDDHIDGGEDRDTLHGEDGEDTLFGGGGDDEMHGGAGRDAMTGDAGKDTMHGGEGDDLLAGGADDDHLHGDAGRDVLQGGEGSDRLYGGDGDDVLDAGTNGDPDWLTGGAGDDLFLLSGSWGLDYIEDLAFGDRVEATLDQGMSYEGFIHQVGDSVLTFAGGASETLITLTGYLVEASEIVLDGLLLTILARDPSEPLPEPEPTPEPQPEPQPKPQPIPKPEPQPAPEPEPVVTPKPEPTPVVEPGRVPEPEPPVADPEPMKDPVSPPKDDEVPGGTSPEKDRDGSGRGSSDEILGGARADRLKGDDGADTIRGRGGDDRLWGGDGSDRIKGDDGKDRLYGGEGDDRLYGGSGRDRLYGGEDEDRLFGGSGDDTLKGQGGKDVLKGGAGSDVLKGSQGRDKLHGEDGEDELDGGSGNDRLDGGRDDDALEGGSGKDELLGGHGRDRLHGGSGRDRLDGGEGNDRLEGNDGDDRLHGGEGRDTLAGGRGDDRLKGGGGDDVLAGQGGRDVLWGGDGADRFVFHTNFGRDRIKDFDADADLVDLRGVRGLDGFDDVLAAARTKGDDVRLRLGDHLLILDDIELRELDADHFLL